MQEATPIANDKSWRASSAQAIKALADAYTPLSASEERKMLRSKISADEKRLTLWRHNLRYASLLACEAWGRRSHFQICTPDDLQAVAVVALWTAAGTFDPARNVKFISYCKWTITRAMNEHLRKSSAGFSIPPTAFRKFAALKIYEETGRNDGRFSQKTLDRARGYKSSVKSIDTLSGFDSGGEELSHHHKIAGDEDLVAKIETPELHAVLGELLDKLARFDPRLPDMMRDYYGIDGRERLNYEQIGGKHGVTRQRVEQQISRGLRRLRDLVHTKGIKFQDLLPT